MKKIYMILLLVAASHQCTTANNEADYDTRPTNQAPQLERPAWPNYDVHNENSFAVFNTVLSVPEPQGTRFNGGFWTLYRCKDATYVTFDWTVPSYQDWWFFRFTTGSAIIDADTGDQYLLRELEYFPMDQCFWIHDHSHGARLCPSAARRETCTILRSRSPVTRMDGRYGNIVPYFFGGRTPSPNT